MIRFIVSLLALFIILSYSNLANDSTGTKETEDNLPRHYLGFSVSSISSLGISYHFMNKKHPDYAYKFTLGLLPDLYDENLWLFFGAEYQSKIYQNDFSRLFWILGAGYESLYLSAGTGVGYELYSGNPGIAINLDLGISILKAIPNPHAGRGNYGWDIAPGIGIGLSYAY